MNNYLSIANSILNGSLRPWLKENQDEEKFRHLLNASLRQNKDTPSEFCKSAVKAFDELRFTTENENMEELKELSQINTAFPLNVQQPQFYNKQTEFYAYLITNTSRCILAGVKAAVEDSDEIDSTYKLYLVLNKLESLIQTINTEHQTHKSTSFILDTLSLYLFIIHATLLNSFDSLIDFETLSENEVVYQLCPELDTEKDNKSKLGYYLAAYMKQPQEQPEVEDEKSAPQPEPKRVSFDSFRYIDYEKKYDNLTNLWDSLKKNNFIAADTDSRAFKKVFSGNEITKQIVWSGNPSEFAYFIKLIYNVHQLVEDLKQKQWEVACKCFIQADGSPFERSKLRTLKRPQLSYKQLEQAVDNLK